MAEIVFINCFEVPIGREEAFLQLWEQIDGFMCRQPGFRWRRLHRALDPGAKLRYVNVAGWASASLIVTEGIQPSPIARGYPATLVGAGRHERLHPGRPESLRRAAGTVR
jgi:hypothetical protein